MHFFLSLITFCTAVAESDEHSAPDRRARVRDSPGETLPCTLMPPGACKIRRVAILFKFPSKLYLWGTKVGKPSPPWRTKFVIACLRSILRDES